MSFKRIEYHDNSHNTKMVRFKNILQDLFFFLQMLVYWPIAFLLLKPLWMIDKKTGAGYFKYIDRLIRKIAG